MKLLSTITKSSQQLHRRLTEATDHPKLQPLQIPPALHRLSQESEQPKVFLLVQTRTRCKFKSRNHCCWHFCCILENQSSAFVLMNLIHVVRFQLQKPPTTMNAVGMDLFGSLLHYHGPGSSIRSFLSRTLGLLLPKKKLWMILWLCSGKRKRRRQRGKQHKKKERRRGS